MDAAARRRRLRSLATLDGRLDSARRLRLARDAWAIRRDGLVGYQRRIRPAIDRLRRSSSGLEQIRQLSGPAPDALNPLAARLTDGWRELKTVRPPAEAEAVHNLLVSAAAAGDSRRLVAASGD